MNDTKNPLRPHQHVLAIAALAFASLAGSLSAAPTAAEQMEKARAAREPQSGFIDGDPRDHLPPHITHPILFGERPDWHPDGTRFIFLSKVFGDVFEYELATGQLRCLTVHFNHYGFTRALYLSNGDILLSGPNRNFDETDRNDRKKARGSYCELSVLDRSFTKPPTRLGVLAEEGPAVSPRRLRIAWTQNNEHRLQMGDIVYDNGVPRLDNVRTILDTTTVGRRHGGFETQNFIPPNDRYLTVVGYRLDESTNTDSFVLDSDTGALRNFTQSPDDYDEVEGIFPDGRSTTVESCPSRGSTWPLPDLFRVDLADGRKRERLTFFSDYRGWKGVQGVVSSDGKRMLFQIGKAGDEAGRGYGIFLYDFEKAPPSIFNDAR